MKKRLAVTVVLSFCALPVLSEAQDDEAAAVDPEDAIIRLDPNADDLDIWSQLRDTADDADREPGLIPIGRLQRPGVLSFFQLPLALTPEDLRAANVDVAILGAGVDMGLDSVS